MVHLNSRDSTRRATRVSVRAGLARVISDARLYIHIPTRRVVRKTARGDWCVLSRAVYSHL